MARYWCEKRFNGDQSPEIVALVKEELESFDYVGLAWLWREALAHNPNSHRLADFDPWKAAAEL